MLIDVVAQEAQSRGLTCDRADVRKGLREKCVLIAGYACQIVPLRLYPTGKNSDLVEHSLYLPRSDWPDFIIYVFANGRETSRFFIVPRGEMSKETSVCASNNWLFKYENAWPLLSAGIAREKLARRFDDTPWKLRVVIRKAKAAELDVQLIGTKNLASRHIKDRLLINSCKCQVITAGGPARGDHTTPIINLYAPTDSWADFLIFVVADTVEHVFIVPRSKIARRTTTTLTSKWLAKYADNWDAVIARDPSYESRSAVIDDPAVQAEVVQSKVPPPQGPRRHSVTRVRLLAAAAKVRRKEKVSKKRDELMKQLPTILPKYTLEEELDYLVQRANAMFKRP